MIAVRLAEVTPFHFFDGFRSEMGSGQSRLSARVMLGPALARTAGTVPIPCISLTHVLEEGLAWILVDGVPW